MPNGQPIQLASPVFPLRKKRPHERFEALIVDRFQQMHEFMNQDVPLASGGFALAFHLAQFGGNGVGDASLDDQIQQANALERRNLPRLISLDVGVDQVPLVSLVRLQAQRLAAGLSPAMRAILPDFRSRDARSGRRGRPWSVFSIPVWASPPRQYAEIVERLCDSAVDVGHEIIEAARNEPQWHGIAKQMLHAWNDGMEGLRRPRNSIVQRGLSKAIEAAGFSDPEPPEKDKISIGRSELLAQPRKK